MTDLQDTQRRLEEEAEHLKKLLKSSEKMNKDMIDEHDALNTAFNSLQKKLKETESENDQLVSVCVGGRRGGDMRAARRECEGV